MKRLFILLLAVCTIGITQAQVGIYRSAGYGAIKKEKVHRPRRPLPNAMIGIAGGLGLTSCPYVFYMNGALNFDFAISITQKAALGGFMHWGMLENWAFGAQVVAGDYFNHKGAFIAGIGYALNARAATYDEWYNLPTFSGYNQSHPARVYKYTRDDMNVRRYVVYNEVGPFAASGAFLRLGFIAKNNFYMTFDLGVFPKMYRAIIDRYESSTEIYTVKKEYETAYTTTLSFGYAFNVAPKRKNQLNEETAL